MLPRGPEGASMAMHDLSASIEPLRAWFNAHAGATRLVAITSPT